MQVPHGFTRLPEVRACNCEECRKFLAEWARAAGLSVDQLTSSKKFQRVLKGGRVVFHADSHEDKHSRRDTLKAKLEKRRVAVEKKEEKKD
jgi:hypothetical protein